MKTLLFLLSTAIITPTIHASGRRSCPYCSPLDAATAWATATEHHKWTVVGKLLNEKLVAVFESGKPVQIGGAAADPGKFEGEATALMAGELQINEVIYDGLHHKSTPKTIWVTFTRPVNWGSSMEDIAFKEQLFKESILMIDASMTGYAIAEDMNIKYLAWLREERDRRKEEEARKSDEEARMPAIEGMNNGDPFAPESPRTTEQPGAGQPATKPADKVPAEAQTPTPTPKDAPR